MEKTWSWSVTGGQFEGKSHQEITELCHAAGLSGIEGGSSLFDRYSEAELEEIGKHYRDAGISIQTYHLPFSAHEDIANFYETVRREAVNVALRSMERSTILGSTVGIQHPNTSRFGVEVEGIDNYFRQLGKSLDTLLPAAEKLNYTIAIENMLPAPGVRFGSIPEHFERILKEFDHPSLGFCLDTGHALVAMGLEQAHEVFEAMAPKLVAFHLADNAGDRDSHLAPGHGLVDWNRVFRKAAEIDFTRNACIETAPFAPGPNYSLEAYQQMVTEADALVEKALAD